MVVVVGNKIVS